MIERIPITDRAAWLAMRRKDVTASAAAALLPPVNGEPVHPWMTAYSLWCEKTHPLEAAPETPAMRRGRLLEPVAVAMICEDFPDWFPATPGAYYRDPDARLGATPDLLIERPDRPGLGVCQVKTCAESVFREKWIDPDTRDVIPPLWIATQAIVEADLTQSSWACVAALVITWAGNLDLHIVEVPVHQRLIARIRTRVAEFWRMVEEGRAPDPDWCRDGELLMRMNRPDDDAPAIDLSHDEALGELLGKREYESGLIKLGDAATKRRREIDGEIAHKLGNAPAAHAPDGRLILRKTIRREGYSVEASQYVKLSVKDGRGSRGRALAHAEQHHEGPF